MRLLQAATAIVALTLLVAMTCYSLRHSALTDAQVFLAWWPWWAAVMVVAVVVTWRQV